MNTLNPKQQKFCDEYLISGNATNAAIKAGYSPSTAARASDWINEQGQEKPSSKFNPELRDYIDKQLEALHSPKIADAAEVMEYLTFVMRGETTSSVLALCGDGCQEVIEKGPDEKERLKAAELIGKRYGIFAEKLEHSGGVDVNNPYASLTPDELRRLAYGND